MNKKLLCFIICIQTFVSVFELVLCADIDERIYGGSLISISDAPYQVSVRLKNAEAEKFGLGHICGGSIITSRVVITAAHCIASSLYHPLEYRNPSDFTLVMGDTYLLEKTSKTLQFSVLSIVVHPNFNTPTSLQNDLALMFFNGNVPVNYNTARIVPLNTRPLADNTPCKVSGWGKVDKNHIPDNLMEATVPIVGQSICETNYGFIPKTMICAGYMATGGVDACQGDSGGPLVCNNDLAGIVSWGSGCAEPGYPGIYTNVSYYVGWIENTNATFNYSLYRDGSNSISSSLILLVLSGIIVTVK